MFHEKYENRFKQSNNDLWLIIWHFYALRVFPAETRLTVYRRRRVRNQAHWRRAKLRTNLWFLTLFCFRVWQNSNSFSTRAIFYNRRSYCGSEYVGLVVWLSVWGTLFLSTRFSKIVKIWKIKIFISIILRLIDIKIFNAFMLYECSRRKPGWRFTASVESLRMGAVEFWKIWLV